MTRPTPAPTATSPIRLGVIGDVHECFDRVDVDLLDGCRYDAILFVGDLANFRHRDALQVAECISRLQTPTLVMPGNHDATHAVQMAAEVLRADPLIDWLPQRQRDRGRELERALHPARWVGYSAHSVADGRLGIVAARPHSAGGSRLSFRPYLRERFGVSDLAQSAERIGAALDESRPDCVVFLAHNGPTGLGEGREDIWGCDFRKSEGDFGDPDLAEAIERARDGGRRVAAVVAGHMHHALRGGGQRRWRRAREGILYVNAARVPRIFKHGATRLRHHVELIIGEDAAQARAIFQTDDGTVFDYKAD